MNTLTKYLLLALSGVVAYWMIRNNYEMLMIATGGNQTISIFGTALFDVGCFVWMLVYIHLAEGKDQRATALATSFFDFVMSVVSVGIHLSANFDKTWLGWVVTVVLLVTVANGFSVWFFHIKAPKHIVLAQQAELRQETFELAMKKANEKRAQTADRVADDISESIVNDANNLLLATHAKSKTPLSLPAPPNEVESLRAQLAKLQAQLDARPAATMASDAPDNAPLVADVFKRVIQDLKDKASDAPSVPTVTDTKSPN